MCPGHRKGAVNKAVSDKKAALNLYGLEIYIPVKSHLVESQLRTDLHTGAGQQFREYYVLLSGRRTIYR
jgi:hypothetical protein